MNNKMLSGNEKVMAIALYCALNVIRDNNLYEIELAELEGDDDSGLTLAEEVLDVSHKRLLEALRPFNVGGDIYTQQPFINDVLAKMIVGIPVTATTTKESR